MLASRCPQCQLLLDSDEWQTGTCPVCAEALPVQGKAPTKETNHPTPTPPSGRAFLLGGAGMVLFVVGGLFGFMLHEGALWAAPVATDTQPVALATVAPPTDDDTTKRLKELEARNDKLRRELESHKKQIPAIKARAEADRHELERAIETKDVSITELEDVAEGLKKDLAESRDREVAAARDAEKARKEAQPAQSRAYLEQVALVRRLSGDLETQKRLTVAAESREKALRQNLEQVRQNDQRTLEQTRQQGQKNVEQVRKEGQQALEQVRKQLEQQQKETQQTRAEAEKHKRAAEEAKKETQLARAEAEKHKRAAEEAKKKNK